ncbi:MAG: cell division protein ZapE [Gammaproteobacteria bacterium]|nr:cell division protein ZapE [Gammaproteobacteria bacterium]
MSNSFGYTEVYQRGLIDRGYTADAGQTAAVAALDALGARLCAERDSGVLQKLKQRIGGPEQPEKGLYLWGGVGRGKTYLMDLFFEMLPIEEKRRSHFHRFMQDTHDQLGALGNTRDPLMLIAKNISAKTRVLCFDEFFVSDIGDAMILGNLLSALFDNEVTLVATSNVPPKHLYRDGLQRQRFLPAIAQLEQHTKVMGIGAGADYRLRVLESAEIYHHPLDDQAEDNLMRYLSELAPDRPVSGEMLQIAGRLIATRRSADGLAWFDFNELCTAPRSPADYLEIARLCHTVLVSGVPVLDAMRDDDMRRFIGLVDVFYDRRVKLIISAAAPPELLYTGDRLAFEYQRTQSRLNEMQATDYLAQPHLP